MPTAASALTCHSKGPSPVDPAFLSSLRSTQQLLQLIAHRNRNQHRTQRWWKWFGMLRRSLKRLVEALEEWERERTERRGRVRAVFGGGDGAAHANTAGKPRRGQPAEIQVATWRDWLEGRVGEMAVAFSSLIADPQFAPLGIVLFAILAELCHKLRLEVPGENMTGRTTEGLESGDAGADVSKNQKVTLKATADIKMRNNEESEDLGEVVDQAELQDEEPQEDRGQPEREQAPTSEQERPRGQSDKTLSAKPISMSANETGKSIRKGTASPLNPPLALPAPHRATVPSKRRRVHPPGWEETEGEAQTISSIARADEVGQLEAGTSTTMEKEMTTKPAATADEGRRKKRKRKKDAIDELFGGLV